MTTIAYKDGIIAYESRVTMNGDILSDNDDKHMVLNGVHFFGAGDANDIMKFPEEYLYELDDKDLDCNCIVIEDGKVYITGKNGGRIWKCELMRPYAIGSGSEYAMGAMDAGATAREAVKIAIGRDTCSGGKIRTFKVR